VPMTPLRRDGLGCWVAEMVMTDCSPAGAQRNPGSWCHDDRPGLRYELRWPALRPHPEERALARVSKDARGSLHASFKTHRVRMLLGFRTSAPGKLAR